MPGLQTYAGDGEIPVAACRFQAELVAHADVAHLTEFLGDDHVPAFLEHAGGVGRIAVAEFQLHHFERFVRIDSYEHRRIRHDGGEANAPRASCRVSRTPGPRSGSA